MTTAKSQILCLLALSACILSAVHVSIQDGAVHICVGQPQIFLCEVPLKQGSITRLEWRIDFEPSSSEASAVIRLFTSDDPEGHILIANRPGVTFVFNLTSTGSSSLVSVMNLTVDDINATALINNAIVNCDNETNQKLLRIIEGSPSTQMNFTRDLMKVQWNPATLADHYIISVSPPIKSESTFMTFNTTIQLPLQYNLDYNISVMASNCAGNSTPAEITVRVGYCTLSSSEYGNVTFMNENSIGGMEGSQIAFYCHSNRNKVVKAMCSNDGNWYPDPHKHKCQNFYKKTSNLVHSEMVTWHVIMAVIIVIIAMVLLVITSAVIMLTFYRKHSSQKIKLDHSNYSNYSDLPSSQPVNENQELGIYSLLQPEEQMVAKVQSTDQTAAAPVYADVGSILSCNPNTNTNNTISLQLDDDRVQYADINHHQQTPELHQKECVNSNTDTPAVDLDTLLIHLRSDMTHKWHQFGEAVGMPEEILKKYSNYPPEECIVEVFDYWLRSHSLTDKPTWRDVADVLMKMELQSLADRLMQNGPPVPVDMNTMPEHLLQPNLQQSSDELPPPLPPKIVDLDKEMMSSDGI